MMFLTLFLYLTQIRISLVLHIVSADESLMVPKSLSWNVAGSFVEISLRCTFLNETIFHFPESSLAGIAVLAASHKLSAIEISKSVSVYCS